MKGTLFKEVSYSLFKLIEDIDNGEIGLPDIQRPFVWNAAKVRDLFNSMYKGFPVGYLLLWQNSVGGRQRQIGTNAKQKIPDLLIVDGRQRLTSLCSIMKGKPVMGEDYVPKRIQIAFRPSDGKFDVCDAAIEKDPEFIPDISQIWVGGLGSQTFLNQFFNRLRKYREVDEDEVDHLATAIDVLRDLEKISFTVIQLTAAVSEEQVAEVFVRINSKGVTLKQADFILTLMSVFWDEGRAKLERFCRNSRLPSTSGPSPFNYFVYPEPDMLLRASVSLGFRRAKLEQIYSILRGKDLETGQFSNERRVDQFEVLRQAQEHTLDLTTWHEFLKVPLKAGYRAGWQVSSKMGLMYSYGLFLIGRYSFGLDFSSLRSLIARWFFMAAITGRYSSSPESQMEEDLLRIRNLRTAAEFTQALEGVTQNTFTEDYWSITLPGELETSANRVPSLYAYYAALCLLDAKVLFSDLKVSDLLDSAIKSNKGLERHHLFPRGYLRRLGITDLQDTNQLAIFALVE